MGSLAVPPARHSVRRDRGDDPGGRRDPAAGEPAGTDRGRAAAGPAHGDDRDRTAPRVPRADLRRAPPGGPSRWRLPDARAEGLVVAGQRQPLPDRPGDQRADRGARARDPARVVHDPDPPRAHGPRRRLQPRQGAPRRYLGRAYVDARLGHLGGVHRDDDHRARGGAVRHAARRRERDRAAHTRLSRPRQGVAHRDDRPDADPLAHDPGGDRARDRRGDLPAERDRRRRQRFRALAVRGDTRRRADARAGCACRVGVGTGVEARRDARSSFPNGCAASGRCANFRVPASRPCSSCSR